MASNVLNALEAIHPGDLDYSGWLSVGMGLKAEGFDCGIWDDWSRNDSRYRPGECAKKWAGFNGSGVTGGTIIHMAQERGWTARSWTGDGAIGWDDEISDDGPNEEKAVTRVQKQSSTKQKKELDLSGLDLDIEEISDSECRFNEVIAGTEIHFYVEDLIEVVKKLYRADEKINYVSAARYDGTRGKWIPGGRGITTAAGDFVEALKQRGADAIRQNAEAGVWMRMNPLDGGGVKDENVAAYRFALVECDDDDMPPAEQEKTYRRLKLPIAAMIYSGRKSLHAWIRIDAPSEEKYRERVRNLYTLLEHFGLKVDRNNKNPARLSRMPGAVRGDQVQRLIDTDIGFDSWTSWAGWMNEKIKAARAAKQTEDHSGETVEARFEASLPPYENNPVAYYYDKDGRFHHEWVAEDFMNRTHSKIINGALHIYDGRVYKSGVTVAHRALLNISDDIKTQQRNEVMNYVNLKSPEGYNDSLQFIAFENGLLNLNTGQMQTPHPDIIVINQIPWEYTPNAKSEFVEHFLDQISCGNKLIKKQLCEIAGACLYRSNTLGGGRMAVLLGDRANGKSTYIGLLKAMLGPENYSVLDICEVRERFSTVELFGRLANLGDDISDIYQDDVSALKKIVTGESLKAEQKGQPVFKFTPYCTMIFSANTIPKVRDPTGAFQRRLMIIPMNARFSPDAPGFDPEIRYKLQERQNVEAFIVLAIAGLQTVIRNKRFTESEDGMKAAELYQLENNPTFAFAEDIDPNMDVFFRPVTEVYARYREWCAENGAQAKARNSFSRDLHQILRTQTISKKVDGRTVKFYEPEEGAEFCDCDNRFT